MIRSGMTRLEATQEWVRGFNAISTQMIAKLWNADLDDWREVTFPAVGDRAYVFDIGIGEVVKVNIRNKLCKIKLDNGKVSWFDENQVDVKRYDVLPMWGTMWSFGDVLDDYRLKEKDGIMLMSQCGFRIFESAEFGYFFGIDGAGYDFYEAHWIPLYTARGLKWHDSNTDNERGEEHE